MIKTADIGLAIRDALEDAWVDIRDDNERQPTGRAVRCASVDCSDVNNLTLYMENGATFTVRIFAP